MRISSWSDAKHAGIAFILLASLMWALEPVAAKIAYNNSDFLHTSAIRALFAFFVALAYVLIRGKGSELRIRREKVAPIVFIALAGTVFADLLYFYAISSIPVVNAVIIGHMQPIFILILGFFILRENLSVYDYGGMAFMMLSGIAVTTRNLQNLISFHIGTVGDALVLVSTITWASTALIARKYLRNVDAGVISFYRFSIAFLLFSTYLILFSRLSISSYAQIATGIIVGLGTIFYYEGLHRIKAAQVSALELSSPFFAAILGFVVLGEALTYMQMAGMMMLFLGIYFLAKREEN